MVPRAKSDARRFHHVTLIRGAAAFAMAANTRVRPVDGAKQAPERQRDERPR